MRAFSCPYECVDDTAEKRHLEKKNIRKCSREKNEKDDLKHRLEESEVLFIECRFSVS